MQNQFYALASARAFLIFKFKTKVWTKNIFVIPLSYEEMAGVAKWLRPRIVVPIYMGSNPIIRPIFSNIWIREFHTTKVSFVTYYAWRVYEDF